MTLWYVLLGLVVGLAGWLVAIYNRLVRGRNLVAEAWSGIDVQLKRRADLIPNLLASVKGYMAYERGLLEEIANLRARSLETQQPAGKGLMEGQLSAALGRLMAVAESYPDLKASQNFLDLQGSLACLEEQLQLARRYYNGASRDYNVLIQSVPSNLVAGAFQFREVEYCQVEDPADRVLPKVAFN